MTSFLKLVELQLSGADGLVIHTYITNKALCHILCALYRHFYKLFDKAHLEIHFRLVKQSELQL